MDKLKIPYKTQYKIDDCKLESQLRFDAFDILHNIAFEFNGEQHYRPVDFSGKGEEWTKKQFEITQKRDNAKIDYCNKNNIPMIIIPYTHKFDLLEYLKEELKKKELTKILIE